MSDIGTNPGTAAEASGVIDRIEDLIPLVASLAILEELDPSARTSLYGATQQLSLAAQRQRAFQMHDGDMSDNGDLIAPGDEQADLTAPAKEILDTDLARSSVVTTLTTAEVPTVVPQAHSVLSSPPTRPVKVRRSRAQPTALSIELAEGEVSIFNSVVQFGRRKIQLPLVTATLLRTLSQLGGETSFAVLLAEMNKGQRQHTVAEVENLLEIVQEGLQDNDCLSIWTDSDADGERTIKINGFKTTDSH